MTNSKRLIIGALIGFSLFKLLEKLEYGMAVVVCSVVLLLLFFSIVSRKLKASGSSMADEVFDRTMTWWWMIAIFSLAISVHKLVSFIFLGLLCFTSLREFYSLVPMNRFKNTPTLNYSDRIPIFFSYLAIPVIIFLAYIKWYDLFIITVPVYLFLFIPILFVIQNRTENVIYSMGYIVLGFMFFVYNFGHCLFLINLGAMLLLFCFALTEARDVISFWIGKSLTKITEGKNTFVSTVLNSKIAPGVSPNKTWSAGLLSAVLTGILAIVFVPIMPRINGCVFSIKIAFIAGILIGILGQLGDLVFSMIKRDAGKKDSGSLLPGHGGIIDRVDSLIFTIPVTFHFIYWYYY